MTEKTFQDETEMMDWIATKYEESEDPDHPPRWFRGKDGKADNWRLHERWLVKEKGQERSNQTRLEENLERKSENMSGALQLLNTDGGGLGNQAAEHKHKGACSKVVSSLRRLGAAITTTEGMLPTLKRRSAEGEYLGVKKGLALIREKKVDYMDMFEDLKTFVENECDLHLDELAELLKKINDDVQALQELAKKHKTPMIKDEQRPPAQPPTPETPSGQRCRVRHKATQNESLILLCSLHLEAVCLICP